MSSMNIVDDQLAKIVTGNRFYQYQKGQWHYYLEGYLGGEDWKRGQHLVRYQLETEQEYNDRIKSTPYENHVKAVVNVYNSFLFRNPCVRDMGSLDGSPEVESFIDDADMEGRSLNAFMKDVSTWASVYGHCWILMAKPDIGALTRADEMANGVRPYVNLLTPLNVIDWEWERSASGYYDLVKFKYIEEINGSIQTLKQWTKDEIHTWEVDFNQKKLISETIEVNVLGVVPAICAYNTRSAVRGMGISDIGDILDISKAIYNMLSEVEQTIRMDSHPSLVKTAETLASSGSGSIIQMPENMDPGLKPYLLEFNGASVDSIYKAIEHSIDTIDKLANTGSVRSTASKSMSGLAMQTEFQLLNAKLSEKADNLELAEEQMWELFAQYQGTVWDGEIDYPDSFSIQDQEKEFSNLQMAKSTATGPEALAVVDQMLIDLLTAETDMQDNIILDVPVDVPVDTTQGMPGANPSAMGTSSAARSPVARTYFSTQGNLQ
jgi:hypothetical protein